MRPVHDHHQRSPAAQRLYVPLGVVRGPQQADVRVLDHTAVHAEDEQLGQVVGQRQQALDHHELVSHEYHVERGQAEVQRAEHQLEQYDEPVALVQLVLVEDQTVVEPGAHLYVVQELLLGGSVGRPIVFHDLGGVLNVCGQYLKLGDHLADEERERTHDSGNDELYGHHDQKLNHY